MNFAQNVELLLEGMAFSVKLGCCDEERSFPQVVEFDLKVNLSGGSDYSSDNIQSTIDYLDIAKSMETLIVEGEWKLLEKLCHDCASTVLILSDKIQTVTVKATKRRIAHIRGVSCQIVLSKKC